MKSRTLLVVLPFFSLGLTGCGQAEKMICLINQSTYTIHENREAIEASTYEIQRNRQLVEQSSRAIEENNRHLEQMSES
jgi:hypothetical protein